jgi:hypothetical protein
MEEIGFIRHGHKKEAGKEVVELADSGLSFEDQEIWKQTVEIRKLSDPEITFENIPLIKQLAQKIFEGLPEQATIIFTSTPYPRAQMTTELISTYLMKLAGSGNKEINIAYVLEPKENIQTSKDIVDVSRNAEAMAVRMKVLAEIDAQDDKLLAEYFRSTTGNVTHPIEQEFVRSEVNRDLEAQDSLFKQRAEELHGQIEDYKERFKNIKGPVFFYGVGHHTNLIALDVAFNDRTHYESADEIPKPLALWKANTI